MAEHKKDKVEYTHSGVLSIANNKVEEEQQEVTSIRELTALESITQELCKVAEGASVVELRHVVDRVMPKNIEDARELFHKLVRLRNSGDVVVQQATQFISTLAS